MTATAAAPQRILLIATRQVGDVLLVTPLLRSLRRAYPAAVIDALVYTNKGGMLEGNPDCNTVIESDEHPDLAGYRALARRIFRRYDLALTTQANDRGHFYALLASSRRIGIVPDNGWKSAWKRWSCEAVTVLDDVTTHTVVQNLRLADLLAIARHYEVVPPQVPNAADAVRPHLLQTLAPGTYAVVHPYPMWRYKRWTRAGWVALIAHLRTRGLDVVLTGGPDADERAFCASLAKSFDTGVASLAGTTGFGAITPLLRSAAIFVGPDTSVTHQAAAVGVPVVAIYGPTNPVKWGPWPAHGNSDPSPYAMLNRPWQHAGNVLLVQGIAECMPCRMEGCERHKESYSRCLDDLPAAMVITAVEQALADGAGRQSGRQ
ncbi:MAG: glycosyltransferase family 9 protein [Sulfuricaulis sp.]|uniref:glycosyltransferase family 9 protein n=1 Tax=Sulfuricaulis sp. TaxID=2003553 RepID=UPI0034A35D4D